MPFNSKYGPSHIRRLLNIYSRKDSIELKPSPPHDVLGGAITKSPYIHKVSGAFILDTATDTETPGSQRLLTIKQILINELGPRLIDEQNKDKGVFIPVSEEQKIFGLFPRNHWVALHYDPIENKATIIDSRPWYISIFYPTSAAKKSLQAGIKAIYSDGDERAKNLSFKSVYQGVQHNDTHCGAWTTQNILDLAGYSDSSTAVNKQLSKYKAEDELDVVNTLIRDFNNTTRSEEDLLVKKPSLAQRFLAFLGFSVPASPSSAIVTGSTNIIASALEIGRAPASKASPDSEWDTLDEITTPTKTKPDSASYEKTDLETDPDSGLGSDADEKDSISSSDIAL